MIAITRNATVTAAALAAGSAVPYVAAQGADLNNYCDTHGDFVANANLTLKSTTKPCQQWVEDPSAKWQSAQAGNADACDMKSTLETAHGDDALNAFAVACCNNAYAWYDEAPLAAALQNCSSNSNNGNNGSPASPASNGSGSTPGSENNSGGSPSAPEGAANPETAPEVNTAGLCKSGVTFQAAAEVNLGKFTDKTLNIVKSGLGADAELFDLEAGIKGACGSTWIAGLMQSSRESVTKGDTSAKCTATKVNLGQDKGDFAQMATISFQDGTKTLKRFATACCGGVDKVFFSEYEGCTAVVENEVGIAIISDESAGNKKLSSVGVALSAVIAGGALMLAGL